MSDNAYRSFDPSSINEHLGEFLTGNTHVQNMFIDMSVTMIDAYATMLKSQVSLLDSFKEQLDGYRSSQPDFGAQQQQSNVQEVPVE